MAPRKTPSSDSTPRAIAADPASKRRAAAKPPLDPTELKRQGPGLHATGDGRFMVEQSSNGWMVTDNERTNELGLPLVRGPFATLGEAKAAVVAARSGPLPISNLAERIAAIPKGASRAPGPSRGGGVTASASAAPAAPPPPVAREFRSRDGDGLRSLWAAAGTDADDVDDMRLRRFAQRNPGSFIVVAQVDAVIGAGLGGWDGRYGWLHLVTIDRDHRRTGLGTQLVRQIERALETAGCRHARVVDEGGKAGAAFWEAVGYRRDADGYLARDLAAGSVGPDGSEIPTAASD